MNKAGFRLSIPSLDPSVNLVHETIANTTAVHTAQIRLHQTLHGSLLIDIDNFKSSMKIEVCFFDHSIKHILRTIFLICIP